MQCLLNTNNILLNIVFPGQQHSVCEQCHHMQIIKSLRSLRTGTSPDDTAHSLLHNHSGQAGHWLLGSLCQWGQELYGATYPGLNRTWCNDQGLHLSLASRHNVTHTDAGWHHRAMWQCCLIHWLQATVHAPSIIAAHLCIHRLKVARAERDESHFTGSRWEFAVKVSNPR